MKKQLFIFFAALCTLNTNAQTVPNYLPTSGLVGWWPFNGSANDESVNGNNGVVNGPILTTDRFGNSNKAYSFDGVNDNINPLQNNLPFGTNPRTISLWFQRIGAGGNLFSYGSANTSNAYMIAIGSNIISNQGWADDFPVYPSIDNSWHYLVCSFDGLNSTIYLDNINLGSNAMPNWNTIAGSFYFGTRVLNDMDFFNGKLDDIGIWDRALTACEIQKLYNADNGLAIAASSSTICSGQPVVLTASGATNYLWSTGATSSSITINPNINTTYSVTTAYSAACSDTKTVSVTVNQTPTVAVNSTTICAGTNASIIASGAANYSWDNGATTNSISVSPIANTIYTVTGLTNGCSDTKTVSVTVNQTPTIAVSNGTICAGNSFTINPTGAATYTYSNGSATVSPVNTTTYTVIGSSFQNCTSVPQTLTVTVDANSTITSQPINQTLLAGTTAIFTITATVGSVLQWQTNLGLGFQNLSNVSQYSGVNTATLTINNISISNDNQTFRCIAGTGLCSDTSDVAILSLSPVSVTELMLFKNITIYPNPAARQVTIIADANLSGTVFTVYNSTGKSVIEGKINSENTLIDLENLSEGIYLINIGENIKQTFKVIKQ